MTFKADKHVFGMAYEDALVTGHIVYPIRKAQGLDIDDDVMCLSLADNGGNVAPYEFAELLRHPEHDLIPAAVADKLRDALQWCRDQLTDDYRVKWLDDKIAEYNVIRGDRR